MIEVDNNVFVFGANDVAQTYIHSLRNCNVEIKAILDNDSRKQGTFFEGIEIRCPSILLKYTKRKIVIASHNFPGIVNQILEYGIGRNDIFFAPDELLNKQNVEDEFIAEGRKNKILMIANGYAPFIQDRVRKYDEIGLGIDIVDYQEERVSSNIKTGDKSIVLETGKSGLLYLIRNKGYKKILVHFINYHIASLLEIAGIADAPIIIWCHGYEVLPWYRTWFMYSDEELNDSLPILNRTDTEKRGFLRTWFDKGNTKWIFVSDWLCGRVKKWIGVLPKNYFVIHNYINEEYYEIPLPQKEAVTNILSIKNHKNSIYANDVVANAIIELSHRSVFEKLQFSLYGFGDLFDKNFEKLIKKKFSNVSVHKKKLSSSEMRDIIAQNGLVLAPTRYDTHGVTVAEMMAAGRGVIVSSIPVMLELYDENCVSFSEGDNPYSLADEVEYLVNHRDEFIKKCKKAREKIQIQCGFQQTIGREIEIIEK